MQVHNGIQNVYHHFLVPDNNLIQNSKLQQTNERLRGIVKRNISVK